MEPGSGGGGGSNRVVFLSASHKAPDAGRGPNPKRAPVSLAGPSVKAQTCADRATDKLNILGRLSMLRLEHRHHHQRFSDLETVLADSRPTVLVIGCACVYWHKHDVSALRFQDEDVVACRLAALLKQHMVANPDLQAVVLVGDCSRSPWYGAACYARDLVAALPTLAVAAPRTNAVTHEQTYNFCTQMLAALAAHSSFSESVAAGDEQSFVRFGPDFSLDIIV